MQQTMNSKAGYHLGKILLLTVLALAMVGLLDQSRDSMQSILAMYGDWSLEKNRAMIFLISRDIVPRDDSVETAQLSFDCDRQFRDLVGVSLSPFRTTYKNQKQTVKVLTERVRNPETSAHLSQDWVNGYYYLFLNEQMEVRRLVAYLKRSQEEGEEAVNMLFSGHFAGRAERTQELLRVQVGLSNFSEGFLHFEETCAEKMETNRQTWSVVHRA